MPPKKRDTEPAVEPAVLDEQPTPEVEPQAEAEVEPEDVEAEQAEEPAPAVKPTAGEMCGECWPSGGLHPDATHFACVHGSWAVASA